PCPARTSSCSESQSWAAMVKSPPRTNSAGRRGILQGFGRLFRDCSEPLMVKILGRAGGCQKILCPPGERRMGGGATIASGSAPGDRALASVRTCCGGRQVGKLSHRQQLRGGVRVALLDGRQDARNLSHGGTGAWDGLSEPLEYTGRRGALLATAR